MSKLLPFLSSVLACPASVVTPPPQTANLLSFAPPTSSKADAAVISLLWGD